MIEFKRRKEKIQFSCQNEIFDLYFHPITIVTHVFGNNGDPNRKREKRIKIW